MQELQEKHIFSFGGGLNSAALMVLLIDQKAPLDEVVFADTGSEVPETYEFMQVACSYFESHGIPLHVVTRPSGGSLYDTCAKRRVIPSAIWRWSTRDFKVNPIHRYYRSLGAPINQYLAIAYDEIERMKDSRVPYVTNLYPLVDQKITRQRCSEIVAAAGLPVPVKSGCFFCPFNSADRWQWLNEEHPDLYSKAIKLEERSKHFPEQRLTDQVFRTRDRVTLRQLRNRIKKGLPLRTTDTMPPCGADCMT